MTVLTKTKSFKEKGFFSRYPPLQQFRSLAAFPTAKKQNHSTLQKTKKKKREDFRADSEVGKDTDLSLSGAERTALKGAELLPAMHMHRINCSSLPRAG